MIILNLEVNQEVHEVQKIYSQMSFLFVYTSESKEGNLKSYHTYPHFSKRFVAIVKEK